MRTKEAEARRQEPSTAEVVAVADLRMRYGDHDVLRGIDLRVRVGEVVVLLGPNGAGKTTTIEILEGFRRRSAGDVRVLGADPERGDEAWRARLGIVLQSWRDHGYWRVRELLEHLGIYYRPYSTEHRPRPRDVDELIETVGLTGLGDQQIKTLSGGQRRRLDVAIGLVGHPELLFLDEPTAGFDPEARQDFHGLIHRLAEDDTAVVLTTHDLDEAGKLADRIAILVGGSIVADGAPDDLARQFSSEAQVRWTIDGQRQVRTTADPTRFARELFQRHGDELADLDIRRPTLEEAYLSLVRSAERNAGRAPAPEEASR